MQNGVVGRRFAPSSLKLCRNTLPSIVAAVDDSFFLGGALKVPRDLCCHTSSEPGQQAGAGSDAPGLRLLRCSLRILRANHVAEAAGAALEVPSTNALSRAGRS